MAAHPWRDSAFPRRGRWLRRIFSPATNTSIIATIIVWIAISPIRADSIKAPSEPVDTEHLFGFVEGADIGNRGETELVIDSLARVSRSTGSFANTASELEVKYTAFQNFRISGAATLAYYDLAGVTGIEDARRAAVQSLSFDARFRLLDRAHAPFGMTLSVSPHWGLVDETSGVRTDHFGTEIQLLADRELMPDRLWAQSTFSSRTTAHACCHQTEWSKNPSWGRALPLQPRSCPVCGSAPRRATCVITAGSR